jgi:hypothetical protein
MLQISCCKGFRANYGEWPVCWIEAAKRQFEKELTTEQKVNFKSSQR